jgi:hypothetical protein
MECTRSSNCLNLLYHEPEQVGVVCISGDLAALKESLQDMDKTFTWRVIWMPWYLKFHVGF